MPDDEERVSRRPRKSEGNELAELVFEASNNLTAFLARQWILAYRSNPVRTAISTFGMIAVVVTFTVIVEKKHRLEVERRTETNLTLSRQLDNLDQTETNIRELLRFVDEQQIRLRESESVITRLEDEKQELAPLVAADREIVNALFAAQEQRVREAVWRDRGIGFAVGVIGSLLATVIWTISRALWLGRKASDDAD